MPRAKNPYWLFGRWSDHVADNYAIKPLNRRGLLDDYQRSLFRRLEGCRLTEEQLLEDGVLEMAVAVDLADAVGDISRLADVLRPHVPKADWSFLDDAENIRGLDVKLPAKWAQIIFDSWVNYPDPRTTRPHEWSAGDWKYACMMPMYLQKRANGKSEEQANDETAADFGRAPKAFRRFRYNQRGSTTKMKNRLPK